MATEDRSIQSSPQRAPVAPFQAALSAQPMMIVADASKLAQDREDAVRENRALKQENEQLRAQLTKLNVAKIAELEAAVKETTQRNSALVEDLDRLRVENGELRNENTKLRRQVDELQARVDSLAADVETLKRRDNPITIREIMRTLERYICLEIAGSFLASAAAHPHRLEEEGEERTFQFFEASRRPSTQDPTRQDWLSCPPCGSAEG